MPLRSPNSSPSSPQFHQRSTGSRSADHSSPKAKERTRAHVLEQYPNPNPPSIIEARRRSRSLGVPAPLPRNHREAVQGHMFLGRPKPTFDPSKAFTKPKMDRFEYKLQLDLKEVRTGRQAPPGVVVQPSSPPLRKSARSRNTKPVSSPFVAAEQDLAFLSVPPTPRQLKRIGKMNDFDFDPSILRASTYTKPRPAPTPNLGLAVVHSAEDDPAERKTRFRLTTSTISVDFPSSDSEDAESPVSSFTSLESEHEYDRVPRKAKSTTAAAKTVPIAQVKAEPELEPLSPTIISFMEYGGMSFDIMSESPRRPSAASVADAWGRRPSVNKVAHAQQPPRCQAQTANARPVISERETKLLRRRSASVSDLQTAAASQTPARNFEASLPPLPLSPNSLTSASPTRMGFKGLVRKIKCSLHSSSHPNAAAAAAVAEVKGKKSEVPPMPPMPKPLKPEELLKANTKANAKTDLPCMPRSASTSTPKKRERKDSLLSSLNPFKAPKAASVKPWSRKDYYARMGHPVE